MGILVGMLRRSIERPAVPLTNKALAAELWANAETATGVSVTAESSLQYTAVLAAVRVLAESVAGLPCILYQRQGDAKRRATEHYLYPLLHAQPNPELTAYEFFEIGMVHLALWGNCYAEIERTGAGRVGALWPLRPDRMEVGRSPSGGLLYRYQVESGTRVEMDSSQVLHIRGLGSDGMRGYSPISLARRAVGLGLAAEEFGARFFGNGARPGVVLQHPGHLTDEAHERLRSSWETRHSGLSNAQRVAILEEGMTVETVGIPPEDAQFLETRRFQVSEIARIFRVPPHMLGDLERATFSNIEHLAIEFVVHTLRPWLVRWEQVINSRLLGTTVQAGLFIEFLVDGLLRGDTQTRYGAYAIARQWGWLSANDVRLLENMNPVPGGDDYLTPLNMMAVGATQEEGAGEQRSGGVREMAVAGETEQRAASKRRGMARAYRRTLEDVAQRIVNREVNDVRNAATRLLRRTVAEFEGWLEEFYGREAEFVRTHLTPAMLTYAELIAAEIAEELGAGVPGAELEQFVRNYVAARANIWTARGKHGLQKALRSALATGADPKEVLEEELGRMQQAAAGEFAADESVRALGAFSKVLYGLMGAAALIWLTSGAESCEYCQGLDGKTIEVQGYFVEEGANFKPGQGEAFRPGSNIGHPPLHNGCDCVIVAKAG